MPERIADKILIVDDDPAFLDLLRAHVHSFHFPFEEARDGLEAVKKLQQNTFSLIISDLKMPNMDGFALLEHVRNRYPTTGVIIITGYGDSHSYTDVIQAGAIDFLAKPFFRDELEAKINRALREQSIIRELHQLVKNLETQLTEKDATIGEMHARLEETVEKVKQLQAKTVMTTYGPHRIR